jgi:hypothetical protein
MLLRSRAGGGEYLRTECDGFCGQAGVRQEDTRRAVHLCQ